MTEERRGVGSRLPSRWFVIAVCSCGMLSDATSQPTPYTLICVLGYLTAMVLVLDFRIPMLLLPLTLLGICNTRFSTRRPTDVGSEAVIPETPVMSRGEFLFPVHLELHLNAGSESYRNVTPPSSRHSRKLFHIHDDDESRPAVFVVSSRPLTCLS